MLNFRSSITDIVVKKAGELVTQETSVINQLGAHVADMLNVVVVINK